MFDIKNIKNYDVISFDIFDTLIRRDVFEPTDLFLLLEDITKESRINSEIRARQLTTNEDITIDDIYDCVENYKIEDKNKIKLKEKTLELTAISERSDIKEIYLESKKIGKKVIAITDMYLDRFTISIILRKHGYEFDELYISGELKKTKHSGTIYEWLLGQNEYKNKKILHFGDNYNSDIINSKKHNIDSVYTPSDRDFLINNSKYFNEEIVNKVKSLDSIQGSLYLGLIAKTSKERQNENYWYNFGFTYSGIFLYNYMSWLSEVAKQKKVKKLYFMARDAYVMKNIFDSFNTEIETEYFYCSRRSLFIPSIDSLDDETLNLLCPIYYSITYLQYIEQFKIEAINKAARNYFTKKTLNKKVEDLDDVETIKEFYKKHQDLLLYEAKKERVGLLRHLKKINFDINNDFIGFVDSGWSLSSQKYLEKILNSNYFGFYFGSTPWAYNNNKISCYSFKDGEPKENCDLIIDNLDLTEVMTLAYHTTTNSYSINGDVIFDKESIFEKNKIEIAKEINKGAEKFVNDYKKILNKYKLKEDRNLTHKVLKVLYYISTFKDLKMYNDFYVSRYYGNHNYEKLAPLLIHNYPHYKDYFNFLRENYK
jgi:predicted HAD superfamily hydrolase